MEPKKALVLFADGMEEAEGTTIVDVLRRAGVDTTIVGSGAVVTGAHNIQMQPDVVFDGTLPEADLVVLPGGYGGVDWMLDNQDLLVELHRMNQEGKWIAAMCAAPVVLDRAGLLEGKNYTAYRDYDKKIASGSYQNQSVVRDGNLITGIGPAAAYIFAYGLVDALGLESAPVRNKMAFDKEKPE